MKNQVSSGTYLLMDLEMTWLNPFRHGVVEFWGIVMDEKFKIIAELYRDICPPEDAMIDPEALEYNGFTLDRIARWKSYDAFVNDFEIFFDAYFPTNPPIIVWQYVTADIVFLESIFSAVGRNDLILKLGNDIIDTKSIANYDNAIARYNGKKLPYQSTSLSKPGGLAEVFGVKNYKAHSAQWDIYATREILMRMLKIGE